MSKAQLFTRRNSPTKQCQRQAAAPLSFNVNGWLQHGVERLPFGKRDVSNGSKADLAVPIATIARRLAGT